MEPIYVFTDGACKGNPGTMGIGIVIIKDLNNPNSIIKIGKYIGYGTNNIAELTAIDDTLTILLNDPSYNRPVELYTDSQYSINVLTRFKSKANKELINQIKSKLLLYKPGIQLNYVPGHNNNPFNELADELASTYATHRGRI